MDISLQETLQLDKFKGFRLIAGKNGLKRKVTKIGLLDHEMLNPIKGQFIEGEFALSTLLAAKDDPELIYSSVLYLIESQASGLGVKDVYYKELPDKVIQLANDHDFSIFMFDNSVYFEDIITEFKSCIDAVESEASISVMINNLLSKEVDEEESLRCYKQLIGQYDDSYRCSYIYFDEKNISETTLIMRGHRLSKRLQVLAVFPYKQGLFVIDKGLEWAELSVLLEQENVTGQETFYCGLSDLGTGGESFRNKLLRSLALSRISNLEAMTYCNEDTIGIYELVLTTMDIPAIQTYKNKIIDPIISYDKNNNASMFETAEAFVKSEGQIKGTAKLMIQHDNTIRYRLSKIKSIIGVTGSDILLYERLSLVIRLHWMAQLDY